MTADELASFRALLQAQAPPPPRPDRGLFARMRARLTVVERTEPPAGHTPRARPAGPPRLEAVIWDGTAHPAPADPPPSHPPAFGRREIGPEPQAAPVPAPLTPGPAFAAVRLRRRREPAEAFSTPEEPPPTTFASEAPLRSEGPAPGRIAGWSTRRPPSAQRRILQRLEAVIGAERQGLDARIAADARSG